MRKEKISEMIKTLAEKELGVNLLDQMPLHECGLDSLSLVALIAEIEDTFNIIFSDEDLQPEKLVSLQSLVQMTEKYL